MTPLIAILVVLAYLALLFTISYLAGRGADNAGFFVGGRQSNWFIVALATIGSMMSGVTYVSVPGMVAQSSFSYLQMVMGFVVGQFIIAFVLVPIYYKLNLVSIYQYLQSRFGLRSYQTGAWFFFVSKMLGAGVRLYLVCLTLQLLIFDPLHLPFALNVLFTMLAVWIYTFRGGVKSIIWADLLKTICLITSVVLCIYYVARGLGYHVGDLWSVIWSNDMSQVFFVDDINDKRFFPKQFFAGVFTMIATSGLDQDLMQRNLSCRNSWESTKNMMVSGILQFLVVTLFLMLGVLLYLFAAHVGLQCAGDPLFTRIATGGYLPLVVGVLFLIGLVAASMGAAGSALTALTTSFTVDILRANQDDEQATGRKRRLVHILMAVLMGLFIYVFHQLSSRSVIDAVYTLASYTYGPLLGLFAFGIIMKNRVRDPFIPVVAILSPILCFIIDTHSVQWLGGYHFSYELLIMNALLTFLGLCLLIRRGEKVTK